MTEYRHVFNLEPVTYRFDAERLLGAVIAESEIPAPNAVVHVNDLPIPRELWSRAIVELGDRITIRLIPTGDDAPKILQTLLTFAAIVLSLAFPKAATLIMLAGAALNVGISLAFPPPSAPMAGDPGELQNSPQLSGSRNSLAQWRPIPVVIGKEYRVWPPLAARPYTEIVGGQQFLRMIFEIHHGPCELALADMRIGTDPLSNFEDIEVEIREGKDTDDPRELFAHEVVEQSYSIVLNDMEAHIFVTDPAATECSFDFSYPYGFGCFHEKKGSLLTIEQTYKLEYRETGTGSWTDMEPNPPYGPGVSYQGSGVIKIRARHRGLCQRGFRFGFPNADEWDVRITMLTNVLDSDAAASSAMDECRVTTFRSIWPSEIITLDNVATVSLRIRASEQLSGVVDTFNCLVKPLVHTWNAVDGWNTTLINTGLAAWHFANVLRGHASATPIDDSLLDGGALLNWAQFCTDEELEVSGIIDTEQPKEYWLRQIAATSRAKATIVDGKYSVIVDEEQEAPVQLFTDRNSSNPRGSLKLPDLPHALRVRFADKEANYQIAERLVFDDGYDEETATNIQEIDMWGITDADMAWRHGRYHLAAGRLRRRTLYLDVDFEHIICNRGDRVDVQSASSLLAVGAARITNWLLFGGKIWIYFDSPIALEPMGSKEYQVQVRKSDGIIQTWDLVQWSYPPQEPEGNTFVIIDIPSVQGDDPAAGDLIIIGEKNNVSLPMIVTGIKHEADLRATLELMDYSPEIYDADQGEIPDWDPNITSPVHPPQQIPGAPTILGVISDESVLWFEADGRVVPRAVLSFKIARGFVTATWIQGQYRLLDDEDQDPGETPWHTVEAVEPSSGQISFFQLEEQREYDFRIRAATDYGLASEWVYHNRHYMIGRTTPPPSPTDLQVTPLGMLTWDMEFEPPDLVGYVIRYQIGQETEWSTGIPAHGGIVTERDISLNDLTTLPDGIVITLMVKAIDAAGIESEDFAYIITTLVDRQENVINQDACEPTWTGTKINCSVVGTQLHADTDTGGFWTEDAQLFWTQDSNLFWTNKYKAMTFAHITSLANVDSTARVYLTGQGQWQLSYYTDEVPTPPERRWPGSITKKKDVAPALLIMKAYIPGGPVQGQLHTMHIDQDVPDRYELHANQANTGSGTERVAPTVAFNTITQVICTLAGMGAAAVGYEVVDKNPTLGPHIRLLDQNHAVCAGNFDCELIGY